MSDGARTTDPLGELLAEREALLREKLENNEVIVACRGQMEAAQARKETGEQEVDPRWFARVRARRRHAGWRDQCIAHRLQEINAILREHERSADGDAVELLVQAVQLIHQALDRLRAERGDE